MSEPVRHIFPWREEESLTSGLPIRRPTVDVGVTGPFGSIGAKALIDTGSPRTVFPRGIGDLVGVSFPDLPSECPTAVIVLERNWPCVTQQLT